MSTTDEGARAIPEISSEDARAIVRERLDGTFPGDLGVEVLEVTDEGASGRLVTDRRHLHPGGYVHGGVWVAFADTVAAWGTLRRLPRGHDFTTVEMKVNVFAAARAGDTLFGEARPLHVGRRTQAWEVRVEVRERLGALFVCTQMVLPPRDGARPPAA